MNGGIFLVQDDGRLIEIPIQPYHPEVLIGDQNNSAPFFKSDNEL